MGCSKLRRKPRDIYVPGLRIENAQGEGAGFPVSFFVASLPKTFPQNQPRH
jgi:hypothetical protein